MIFLHNSFDKDSRDFIETTMVELNTSLGIFSGGMATSTDGNHTIYDWYKGGREAFWATGNTRKISAFPSVIIDIPSHKIPRQRGQPTRLKSRMQVSLRKPIDLAAIDTFLTKTNMVLTKSAGEGRPVPLLTRDNASDIKA